MKIKLFVLAVASTFALGSQAATFQNSSFNWNNTSSAPAVKAGKPVGIVKGVLEVAGISRNADNKNTIDPAFAKTSRPCPPFCINATNPFAPSQVDMVTELDMIHAARDVANGDKTLLVVDARTPGWVKKGTIPHAINVPLLS
jgi:hypothetical protein